MSSPQLEDGFFRIANELAESFASTRLAGQEYQVIWAVLRKTYGYGKKSDEISYGQLESITGIRRPKLVPLVKSLQAKHILGVTNNGNTRPLTMWINKHYEQWACLPKKGTVPKNGNSVPKNGNTNDLSSNNDTESLGVPNNGTVPNNGNESVPNNGTHKRKKENKEIPETFLELSRKFHEHQQKKFPTILKEVTETMVLNGAIELKRLVELDHFKFEEEVRPTLQWGVCDDFWADKILSLGGIRKKSPKGLTKFQNLRRAFLSATEQSTQNKPIDGGVKGGSPRNNGLPEWFPY